MELNDINDLFTSSGKVNSAILRRDWFKDTELFKYIMNSSRELNVFGEDQVELSHRVWFIKDNMNVGRCPVCGKPFLVMAKGHGNKTFTLCDCKKNYTSESKSNLLKNRKIRHMELVEYVKSNSNHQTLSDECFNSILDEMNSRPSNFQFLPSDKYKDFYSDLMFKTKDVLPIDIYDIPQRLFIVNNKLNSIPVCEHCHNEMKFYDRFKGYSCPCQRFNKSQDTRFKSYLKKIPTLINQDKYEIVQIPRKLFDGLRIRCRKCGKESVIRINDGRLNYLNKNSILCRHCESYNGTSRGEKDIVDLIRLVVSCTLIENDRTILNGKELDIYIPDRKLAFEYDGLYWHKDNGSDNDRNRHLFKTELCESKGIHLVHIFENEWLNKRSIVESRIKNLLGVYDKIVYARKCEVKEVSSKESFEFQNMNHIQGGVHSSVNIGLYYDDELISLMTFSKPRFNKKYDWELVRFCNKIGYHVPGGASKLLKHFERTYNPKSIISYADRRWSKGNLYSKIGFKQVSTSKPNYWYIVDGQLESRVKYQKHKLKNILEHFDESKSEVQNMKENGYNRIFDCGNLVFLKMFS